jgi:hypothetical protein
MKRLSIAGGIFSAFALGLAVVVACVGDNKGSYLDIHDTPPNGLGVDPGVVTCGNVGNDGCVTAYGFQNSGGVPDTECCAGPGEPGGGACEEAGTTCPPRTGTILCNEEADCNVGNYCCGTITPDPADAAPDSGGGNVALTCCPNPKVQFCRTNGECQNGQKCVVQTCSDGLTYEICGVYAPAGSTFTCKAN